MSDAASGNNQLTESIEYRNCWELGEFPACVDLQREDADLIPVRMFVVAS